MITRFIVLSLLIPCLSYAQTLSYVSDQLEAPLRAGPSARYKILDLLPSGTPLEVLQSNAKAGYHQVRTREGIQGWILIRYTTEAALGEESLSGMRRALETLRAENTNLKKQLTILQAGENGIATRVEQLSNENQRLDQQLAHIRKIAGNAIAIDEQNRILQEQVVELEHRLRIAQQENQFLISENDKSLFMIGAGVLLIGLILGLVLNRNRSQQQNTWGKL